MAETVTLARPYARAAFDLARASGALDAWSAALGVAAGVAHDPRLHALRGDPRVSQAQLVAIHLPPEQAQDGAFARFLGELTHFRRLALLPDIAALFEALKHEATATLKVQVRSALALDNTEVERLKASLKARFQREIEMAVSVEPELLGGVIIDAGSEVIDGSVRGRLRQLAGALLH